MASFKLFAVVALFIPAVALLLPWEMAGGFIAGAVAFGCSALGLEKVSSLVLRQGDVLAGVRSGIFWVVFKFLAPACLIYMAIGRGLSAAAIVVGLMVAVLVFAVILWIPRDVKN